MRRNATSKSFRNALSRIVPRPIGRSPYRLALAAVRSSLRQADPRLEVWPRNGYVLGTLTPFLSDLDLTFWWNAPPEPEDVARVNGIYRRLKSFMPWLGETNLYVAGEAEKIS